MKFSAVTLFAAAAAAAPAARQAATPIYDVTEFQGSCVPHSAQCNYSFRVKQSNSMETGGEGVYCSATGLADIGSKLPGIPYATCEQSSRSFSIVKSTGGLALFVRQPVSPSSNLTAVHQIQNAELQTTTPRTPTAPSSSTPDPPTSPLPPQ
ncbi:hypothetical protein MN608_06561 [Microdochium nivale]|nr:hypothetical protein MN608_06561 [Microdochium nivale]